MTPDELEISKPTRTARTARIRWAEDEFDFVFIHLAQETRRTTRTRTRPNGFVWSLARDDEMKTYLSQYIICREQKAKKSHEYKISSFRRPCACCVRAKFEYVRPTGGKQTAHTPTSVGEVENTHTANGDESAARWFVNIRACRGPELIFVSRAAGSIKCESCFRWPPSRPANDAPLVPPSRRQNGNACKFEFNFHPATTAAARALSWWRPPTLELTPASQEEEKVNPI